MFPGIEVVFEHLERNHIVIKMKEVAALKELELSVVLRIKQHFACLEEVVLHRPVLVHLKEPFVKLRAAHRFLVDGPHLHGVDQLADVEAARLGESLDCLLVDLKLLFCSQADNAGDNLTGSRLVEP